MAGTRPQSKGSGHEPLAAKLDLAEAMSARLSNDLLPPREDDKVTGELSRRFVEHLRNQLAAGYYKPSPAEFIQVPKPGFTSRPAAALTLTDRIVYEALVAAIRPALSSYLVPDAVLFWPRESTSPKRWKDFQRAPLTPNARYVVRADISGFYDSIDHDLLCSELVYATGNGVVVSALGDFLSDVMQTKRGIPQGLLSSDALATTFLQPVDAALVRQGFAYARHGDDVRFAAASISEARECIARFEQELRQRGLLVNSAKCAIVTRANYEAGLLAASTAFDTTRQRLLESRVELLTKSDEMLQEVMRAAELDSQVAWDLWYHGRISVEDVIAQLRTHIDPNEVDVAEAIFQETLKAYESDDPNVAKEQLHHQLASALVRLAAGRSPVGIKSASSLIAKFPDKTDLVCSYLDAVAETKASEVSAQLADVLASDLYTTPWQKAWVLRVLGSVLGADDEATINVVSALAESDKTHWTARVEGMKALARAGKLEQPLATQAWTAAPPVYRSDTLAAICRMAKSEDWARRFVSVAHLDPIDKVVVAHVKAVQAIGARAPKEQQQTPTDRVSRVIKGPVPPPRIVETTDF